MTQLKTEIFYYKGNRCTVAFEKSNKGYVLYRATAHLDHGRNPTTITTGKAHTKSEAMSWVKTEVKHRCQAISWVEAEVKHRRELK